METAVSLPHEAVAGRERGGSGLEPAGDVSTLTSGTWAGATPRPASAGLPAGASHVAQAGLPEEVCQEDVSGEQTFPERPWKRLVVVTQLTSPGVISPSHPTAGPSRHRPVRAQGKGAWTLSLNVEGFGWF